MTKTQFKVGTKFNIGIGNDDGDRVIISRPSPSSTSDELEYSTINPNTWQVKIDFKSSIEEVIAFYQRHNWIRFVY